jgi:urease accessory protein
MAESKELFLGKDSPESSGDSWLIHLLQATDSFYPTGSYAHSFGLEGMIEACLVRDRATLREFVFASAIPSLERNDLPVAAQAFEAFARRSWNDLEEICVLASSLKTARESRLASENIGRQRAELCVSLHAHPLAREFLQRAEQKGWPIAAPIAAALEGQVHGAPLSAVLSSIYYSAISALLAAAMKLLRLGQNASQSLLTEALAVSSQSIERAQQVAREEIGWFNPWLDIAAARHETAAARMFIS